ncbi:hypothetical protein [Streptomyces viridosporus]|uniref:hypothetical protein n=1 Tax=Streptomyces viridosporus TaxID=67581 RepID=UPI00331D8EEA
MAVGIGGSVLYQEVNQRNEAATTSHVSLTYDADFSDDANLAGAAEDLFYGKVTALKGQKDLGIGPETQYAVEVQRVFKGDVTGVVVVNQQGGEDEDGNVVNLPEDDALLEVGKRYLFATKYNPDHRFNTVIPVHGDIPIPDTEAPAPGAPDMNGDGQPTMSDRRSHATSPCTARECRARVTRLDQEIIGGPRLLVSGCVEARGGTRGGRGARMRRGRAPAAGAMPEADPGRSEERCHAAVREYTNTREGRGVGGRRSSHDVSSTHGAEACNWPDGKPSSVDRTLQPSDVAVGLALQPTGSVPHAPSGRP